MVEIEAAQGVWERESSTLLYPFAAEEDSLSVRDFSPEEIRCHWYLATAV